MKEFPKIALTMGDVAGVGPEVIVRALCHPEVRETCHPVVVGHPDILRRTIEQLNIDMQVHELQGCNEITQPHIGTHTALCWNPAQLDSPSSADNILNVQPGKVDAVAGWYAHNYLQSAIQAALSGAIDGIVTAPLNKQGLYLAGLNYPGHTEILAEACDAKDYAMMLYLPAGDRIQSAHGLGVAHVTLHTSVESVPRLLTTEGIVEKSLLLTKFLQAIGIAEPHIGVCALNPHAGEEGLFGDEEERIIQPAVEKVAETGITIAGPLPADTLFLQAVAGKFDGVVAMYHDQGHIPFKLLGFHQAVNITLGLPIIRTSPSHGTAYDIAGKGLADAEGMLTAINIANLLVKNK